MNTTSSFLRRSEIARLGFLRIGENCQISRYARFYNPRAISIGNNVRIDDFVIISGGKFVQIRNNVHIASHATLVGVGGIAIGDFCGVATSAKILSASDTFDGSCLLGPTVPSHTRKVVEKVIQIYDHAQVGSCSIVMPGCRLLEGAVLGAMSFVRPLSVLNEWSVYTGVPANFLKIRSKELLKHLPLTD